MGMGLGGMGEGVCWVEGMGLEGKRAFVMREGVAGGDRGGGGKR